MTRESNGKTHEVSRESSQKKTGNDSFWHIDREMLRFKIHFFLFIGAQGAAIPYIVVFATESLGLSASSVGAVLTMQTFCFIFSKPLIGYIADYFNKLKVIICVLTIINGSGYFLLLNIPQRESNLLPTEVPISENNFEVTDFCQNHFLRHHPFTGLNFTQIATESETCEVCLINSDCFLNVLEHYTLSNETYENVSAGNKESSDENKIKLLFIFKQNCTMNLVLCNDDYKSSFQNCSLVTIAMSYQYGAECKRKVEEIQLCNTVLCKNATKSIHNSYQQQNDTERTVDSKDPRSISDYQSIQFWLFAFIFSLSSVTANATFTLSDTACCESIQKSGAEFGKQRLWGAIGWGAVAPLAGFLNDYTHSFAGAFSLMAIMLFLFIWNLFKLNLVKPHFSKNILRDVGTVLKSKEFLSFELIILFNGIALGMIWFYLILFLRSIGGSELLCGMSLTVQSFGGSIPFMFYSDWIIRKIGHFRVLMLALFTNIVRFLWYSYLYNPWWVLPVEVSHGITYGLYYTALASYGKLSAKPGTEATTQAVLFSTNEGLGSGLGCLFAGFAFDYFGGHKTFFITGLFCSCGFIISIILSFFVIGKQNKTILILQPQEPHSSSSSIGITHLQVDSVSINSIRTTQTQVNDP